MTPDCFAHRFRASVSRIGVARRPHAELAGSTLVTVPEAAHLAHVDNPEVWLGAIRALLRARR